MKREKQTASWKAFMYLIFPLRRFNRRVDPFARSFICSGKFARFRRRMERASPFCSDSRISPFHPPFHLRSLFVSFHPFFPFFLFFSIFFFSLPLLFRAMRRTSATARTLLKLHSCIRELLNFTGIGGGMVALPFEINISTVWKRTSSRDMQTMENYLLSILWRMVCFNLWKCKNVRRVKIDEGLEMWFEFLRRIIQLWNCNFKLDKNIKELRLRTMLNQNKNNFEISL